MRCYMPALQTIKSLKVGDLLGVSLVGGITIQKRKKENKRKLREEASGSLLSSSRFLSTVAATVTDCSGVCIHLVSTVTVLITSCLGVRTHHRAPYAVLLRMCESPRCRPYAGRQIHLKGFSKYFLFFYSSATVQEPPPPFSTTHRLAACF